MNTTNSTGISGITNEGGTVTPYVTVESDDKLLVVSSTVDYDSQATETDVDE